MSCLLILIFFFIFLVFHWNILHIIFFVISSHSFQNCDTQMHFKLWSAQLSSAQRICYLVNIIVILLVSVSVIIIVTATVIVSLRFALLFTCLPFLFCLVTFCFVFPFCLFLVLVLCLIPTGIYHQLLVRRDD